MADTAKPVSAKPDDAAPKPDAILVTILRDYWPKGPRPADLPEDAEYRVRAGETVTLPVEEAIDVAEAGIGTRVRRDNALKI